MAERREDAQQRRAAERERRRSGPDRSGSDAPSNVDAEAGGVGIHGGDAARAAAAAALVGAAAGAFKALTARNGTDQAQTVEEPDEVEQQPRVEPEEPDEPERDEELVNEVPEHGADSGSVTRIVQAARESLRELHGSEAESVSSLEQTANGWAVTLEVVELRRVPDSTDVLASYRVELDRDGKLVKYERTGRYYRAFAERGDAT